jgi:hypothetical protein
MKKMLTMMLTLALLTAMVSCNEGGSDKSKLLALLGIGWGDDVKDPLKIKYLEYIYNNENGKKIKDIAMSGMPVTDEFKNQVNEYLDSGLAGQLGQCNENPESPNCWE